MVFLQVVVKLENALEPRGASNPEQVANMGVSLSMLTCWISIMLQDIQSKAFKPAPEW